jgi:hypothetical protein
VNSLKHKLEKIGASLVRLTRRMSLEDSFKERVAMWRREHDIIYNQVIIG